MALFRTLTLLALLAVPLPALAQAAKPGAAPPVACGPLMLWVGRDLGAMDPATQARARAILGEAGLRDGLPQDQGACASALQTLTIEGFAIDAQASIPPECGPLETALATLSPEQRLAAAGDLFRTGLGPYSRSQDPAVCGLIAGALARAQTLGVATCPALMNWVARFEETLSPAQSAIIMGRITPLRQSLNMSVPEYDPVCIQTADQITAAGGDLSALGLRSLDGVTPDCAGVVPYARGLLPVLAPGIAAGLRQRMGSFDFDADSAFNIEAACAAAHGVLESRGYLAP